MNNAELNKKVKKLVHLNFHEKGYVCSVDIIMQLGYLTKKDYENWRFGRVNYLERVCQVNLNKLTLINKFIQKHSTDLNLKSTFIEYKKYGKGKKHRLQFSKSGDKTIEMRYATHYIVKKPSGDSNK